MTIVSNTNSSSSFSQGILHIPNPTEMLEPFWNAFIALALGRYKDVFKGNPTASSIFTDIIRSPGTYFKAKHKVQIGYTKYYHDEADLYALGSKTLCKASIILGFSYVWGIEHIDTAGRLGNYVCDPISRFFHITQRERQDKEPDKNFLMFIYEDFDRFWILKSFTASIFKVTASDLFGEFVIKKLGYADYIRNIADYITDIEASDIWDKFYNNHEILDNIYEGISRDLGIFLVDYPAKAIPETISAFLLISTAKTAEHLGVAIIDYAYNTSIVNCSSSEAPEAWEELSLPSLGSVSGVLFEEEF